MKNRHIFAVLFSLMLAFLLIPALAFADGEEEATRSTPGSCLTFSSADSFTLATSSNKKKWDGTLEYSTDGSTWTVWDGTTSLTADSNGTEYVLYLRGSGNTSLNKPYSQSNNWVLTGSSVDCNGNIMTLLEYTDPDNAVMGETCFDHLFSNCTALTSAPELPATTLSVGCYKSMFYNTGLTVLPELPATTLTELCYSSMFGHCNNLTSVPQDYLPALELAPNCYSAMFNTSANLTNLPALPATTLAAACYRQMFQKCTSLTTLPADYLPATELANWCYQWMFEDCTGLTTAPDLPATTLAEECYYDMFTRCTSLTTAPDLPAEIMEVRCYHGMFSGCTSLTTVPMVYATTAAEESFYGMFSYCTNLTTVNDLTATTLAKGCYQNMFANCTSLTAAPAISALTLAESCCDGMFYGCTSLTTLPDLPAETMERGCYTVMFAGCTSLTTVPEDYLPATTLAEACYYGMFANCTSLTTAPKLPVTTLAEGCYMNMFNGCTSLTTAPDLPATTLESMCYYDMFANCTSLTRPPELPATTLAPYCYAEMFKNCTGIKIGTIEHADLGYTVEYQTIPYDNSVYSYNNPDYPEFSTPENSILIAAYDMFAGTGGAFTGTPSQQTMYYFLGEAPAGEIVVLDGLNLAEIIEIDIFIQQLYTDNTTSTEGFTVTYSWQFDGETEPTTRTETLGSSNLLPSGYYYISLGQFHAKQMTEEVTVVIKDTNDNEVFSKTYSIQEYCLRKINDPEASEKLKNLCKATLDYGTYAQTYFNYKAGEPANGGTPYYALESIDASYQGINGSLSGVRDLRALNLASQVELDFFFKPESGTINLDDIVVTCQDTTFTGWTANKSFIDGSGYYYVAISGIPAAKLDKVFDVTVTYGGETSTWSWSAMSFAHYAQTHQNEAMQNVAKALAKYCEMAAAYLN